MKKKYAITNICLCQVQTLDNDEVKEETWPFYQKRGSKKLIPLAPTTEYYYIKKIEPLTDYLEKKKKKVRLEKIENIVKNKKEIRKLEPKVVTKEETYQEEEIVLYEEEVKRPFYKVKRKSSTSYDKAA